MKKLNIFIFLFIYGCANTNNNPPPHSYSQNGKKSYTVHCGQGAAIIFGTNRINYSRCYNLAGSLCKTQGFNILNKTHNGYEGIMQFECR